MSVDATGGFTGILILLEPWESHILGVTEITHVGLGSQPFCCPNTPGRMAFPPSTMGLWERVMILSGWSRISGGKEGHTCSWKKLYPLPHQHSPSRESLMETSVISTFWVWELWVGGGISWQKRPQGNGRHVKAMPCHSPFIHSGLPTPHLKSLTCCVTHSLLASSPWTLPLSVCRNREKQCPLRMGTLSIHPWRDLPQIYSP